MATIPKVCPIIDISNSFSIKEPCLMVTVKIIMKAKPEAVEHYIDVINTNNTNNTNNFLTSQNTWRVYFSLKIGYYKCTPTQPDA